MLLCFGEIRKKIENKEWKLRQDGEFVRNVIDEMTRFMFVKSEEDTQQVRVCPLAGKLKGGYPEDYLGGDKDESKMAGK